MPVRTKQNGLGNFVVLGLAEQIHRHPISRRGAIGNYQYFRWARHHVDADHAKNLALGSRDILITRPDNLVDSRNAGCPIRQRTYRLCATDAKYPVDTCQRGRSQHGFIDDAVRSRRDHDEFRDARNFGRDRIHQYRRGVCRLAARHIQTRPIKRSDLCPQHGAIGFRERPRPLALMLVVTANAGGGGFECCADVGCQLCQGRRKLRMRNLERVGRSRLPAIKALREFKQGSVAARPDRSQNIGYFAIRFGILCALKCAQLVELCRKVGVARAETTNRNAHLFIARSNASSSGWMASRFNFSAARLTTRRLEMAMICSTATK